MLRRLPKYLLVCCYMVTAFMFSTYFLRNYRASPVSIDPKVIRHAHQGTSKAGSFTSPIILQTFASPLAKDKVTNRSKIESTAMESMLWKPKTDDVNLKVIFIRIPKTGSRTLEELVVHQLRSKGFRYTSVEPSKDEGDKRRLFTSTTGKVLFAGHTRHMEFQWSTPPIYISLTRDPVERFKSIFYYSFYGDRDNQPYTVKNMKYNRAAMANTRGGNTTIPVGLVLHVLCQSPSSTLTLSECILQEMPFCMELHRLYGTLLLFCGYDPRCSNLSEWTYDQAVKHVNEALAVGVCEEFGDYLRVIERLAPDLFNNISVAYERPDSKAAETTKATKSTSKKTLTPESDEKLRKLMKMEYRIYNYIKDRFHQIKKKLLI